MTVDETPAVTTREYEYPISNNESQYYTDLDAEYRGNSQQYQGSANETTDIPLYYEVDPEHEADAYRGRNITIEITQPHKERPPLPKRPVIIPSYKNLERDETTDIPLYYEVDPEHETVLIEEEIQPHKNGPLVPKKPDIIPSYKNLQHESQPS